MEAFLIPTVFIYCHLGFDVGLRRIFVLCLECGKGVVKTLHDPALENCTPVQPLRFGRTGALCVSI